MDHMTALVSTFARAYHYRNNTTHIFADPLAEEMLTEEEYAAISENMARGISYFAPEFRGTPEEALRFIVDRQLAPPVLARSAFCERALDNAVLLGCRQILIAACGYDTFSLRTGNERLHVFELDLPEMTEDRRRRIAGSGRKPVCRVESVGCDLSGPSWAETLTGAGFDPDRIFFGSLLGISYYLTEGEFRDLLRTLSRLSREGSSLCFDYPRSGDGRESRRNRELAAGAGEPMKAEYSYEELESLLAEAGFLIYEHRNAAEATEAFFTEYNSEHTGHPMAAPEGVGYVLAVKKG